MACDRKSLKRKIKRLKEERRAALARALKAEADASAARQELASPAREPDSVFVSVEDRAALRRIADDIEQVASVLASVDAQHALNAELAKQYESILTHSHAAIRTFVADHRGFARD